jgi:apolipoprotein N-acyltransferase
MISRIFLAIFCGVLVNTSFANNKWYFAILGISGLYYLLSKADRKTRFIILGTFGAVFFGLHLAWVRVLGDDAWFLLTLISALPWLLLGVLAPKLSSTWSVVVFSAGVVAIEVVKSHVPWGGFPWGLIAFSQVDSPFIKFAPIGGQALVSFITVLLSGLLIGLLFLRIRNLLLIISVFLIALSLPNSEFVGSYNVTAIQGNVPRIGLELSSQRAAVLSNHLTVTRQYLNEIDDQSRANLIIWPESSTDIDPIGNVDVGNQISQLVKQGQIPILVGATIWGEQPQGPRNAGILWLQEGPQDIYLKNHLVPFGEYIPFRSVLSEYISRFEAIPNDFVPGNELGLFEVGGVNFGNVICFEIAFGDQIRQLVNSDAQFISVQTNNATYGRTNQPEQQFQISRFRAIEHKRSVIVASTSGISGAIDPNGVVLAKTPQFKPAIVATELPLVEGKSFADQYPRWAVFACFMILFTWLFNTKVRKKIA